jgi:hypothetical protein
MDGPVKDQRVSTIRAMSLALVLACAAGCSSSSNFNVMMFADPGKYQYHTCQQIAEAAKTASGRADKLRKLIETAEQGAGGALVGTLAYRGEYRTVQEELSVIENAAHAKNCLRPSSWRSSTAIQ